MFHFEYSRFDGKAPFIPLSAESAFDAFMEALLEHGENLLDYFEHLPPPDQELLRQLIKEGLLESDEHGRLRLSPTALKRIEEKSLHELFNVLRKDLAGKHEAGFRGLGQAIQEESRPYHFGDQLANLNLHETLRNAVQREIREHRQGSGKIGVREEDLAVFDTEQQVRCATVVLLDMSGSMTRYGKFYHAKKVALALQALVRGRFAEDFFKVIGFYTYASPLNERQLVSAVPKEVSLFDSRVNMRIPLEQLKGGARVPEHFTNIHAGLRFARETLKRQACDNRQIICITDGEPTAHLEGQNLLLIYPPSEKTARFTLEEAARCRQQGIEISTFALIEDAFYLGLVNFVDRLARLTRGVAAYCTAGELGGMVLESFVKGRKNRQRL